jgi:hypothetical protein
VEIESDVSAPRAWWSALEQTYAGQPAALARMYRHLLTTFDPLLSTADDEIPGSALLERADQIHERLVYWETKMRVPAKATASFG